MGATHSFTSSFVHGFIPTVRADDGEDETTVVEDVVEALHEVEKSFTVNKPAPKLEALSAAELEELKSEIVSEVVSKIAGEDGEKLADFLEPECITAPYDPRFPNRNQARHCFVRFNEFHKCAFERGEDHARCQFYKKSYESMCPADWLESWNELREKGLWTGKY